MDQAALAAVGAHLKLYRDVVEAWRAQFSKIDLKDPNSAVLDVELEKQIVGFILQARRATHLEPPPSGVLCVCTPCVRVLTVRACAQPRASPLASQLVSLLYDAYEEYAYDRTNKLVFFTLGSVLQGWRDAAPADVAAQCGRAPFDVLTVTKDDAVAYEDSFSILSLYNYLPGAIWAAVAGSDVTPPWRKDHVTALEIERIVEQCPALESMPLLAAGCWPCPCQPGHDVQNSGSRQAQLLLSVHQPVTWLVAIRFARAQFFVMSYRVHAVLSLRRTESDDRRHVFALPTAPAAGTRFELTRALQPEEAALSETFEARLSLADVPATTLQLAAALAALAESPTEWDEAAAEVAVAPVLVEAMTVAVLALQVRNFTLHTAALARAVTADFVASQSGTLGLQPHRCNPISPALRLLVSITRPSNLCAPRYADPSHPLQLNADATVANAKLNTVLGEVRRLPATEHLVERTKRTRDGACKGAARALEGELGGAALASESQ